MFSINMNVQESHIDYQKVLDGLHYPFYFEKCRHDFIESLGKSIDEYHDEGINVLLSQMTVKYKKVVTGSDDLTITCELRPISRAKFGFYQEMIVGGKTVCIGEFEATCMMVSGGRPFIGETFQSALEHL